MWFKTIWLRRRNLAATRARIIALAGASIVAVLMVAGVGVNQSHREVRLIVDGVERPLTTWNPSVTGVLASAGVDVGNGDQLLVNSTPVASRSQVRVPAGSRIEVTRAVAVPIIVSGKPHTITTVSRSVGELLAENSATSKEVSITRTQARNANLPLSLEPGTLAVDDISVTGEKTSKVLDVSGPGDNIEKLLSDLGAPLGPLDEVRFHRSPDDAEDAEGSAGAMQVTVTRVERELDTKTADVAFSETLQESEDLFVGESVETVKGANGVEQQQQWVERRGGDETRVSLNEKVVTAPTEGVKQVGKREATPQALIDAGLDPQAPLVESADSDGRISVRYEAKLGTISSSEQIAALTGTGTASQGTAADALPEIPLGTYSGADPRGIAQEMLASRGWSGEFSCLLNLWERESGWNPYAENPSSGAYGIPQALPGSKMASAGADWRTNPRTQIEWGLSYIGGRYGTPCGAWNAFQSQGWY